jgi:hypothetical protein
MKSFLTNTLRYFLLPIFNYLVIFIPMTLLILVPIYYFGGDLGNLLIEKFEVTTGLYLRPLVISGILILVLLLLSSSRLEKFNELLWFRQFSKGRIKSLYSTYIYGIGSFALLTLLIVIKTVFFYSANDINWFSSRSYLWGYFLLVLFFSPVIFLVKRENK